MKRSLTRILSLLMATALLLTAMPVLTLWAGTSVTVGTHAVTASYDSPVTLTFTAEESTGYNIYSIGDVDTMIKVYDEEQQHIASNDFGIDGINFFMQLGMAKGRRATLEVKPWSSQSASFSVVIEKAPDPQGVELLGGANEISMALFESIDLDYKMDPLTAFSDTMEFSVGDPNVLKLTKWSEWESLARAIRVGQTTAKLTLEGGVTDTVTVTVRQPIEWQTATPKEVILSPTYPTQTLSFTVDTAGYYELYSQGNGINIHSDLYTMNAQYEYSTVAYGVSRDNGNFRVLAYLEPGKNYYLNTYSTYNDNPYRMYTVHMQPLNTSVGKYGVEFLTDSSTLTMAQGEILYPRFRVGTADYMSKMEAANTNILANVSTELTAIAPGETTLTANTSSGATDTLTVKVVAPPALKVGEDVSISFGHVAKRVFTFTPDSDGTYVFRSNCTTMLSARMYQGDTFVDSDSSIDGEGFCVQGDLKGGVTYRIEIRPNDTWETDTIQMSVERGVAGTSLSLELTENSYVKKSGKTYYAFVGQNIYEKVSYGNGAVAKDEYYDLTWSDPSICVQREAVKAGKTTVTATGWNTKLKGSVTLIVVDVVRGDLNMDGRLSKSDLNMLNKHLEGTADLGELRMMADYNGDCVVNAADAGVLKDIIIAVVGELKDDPGDVNGDGKVNTTDARVVLQYCAEKIDQAELDIDAADADGNGRVNTTDARTILRFCAGLITEWP